MIFVGIDVIGNWLTEINVTSPTGLQQINRFDGVSLEAQIWDRIEVRYQETRGAGHDPSQRSWLCPAWRRGCRSGPALAQLDTLTQKPIVKAVRDGDEEKVRQALLKGENPNQIDSSGRPLLMIAVMDGQVAVVETLLKGGVGGRHAVDSEGYTSLIRAAERGDVDIVDLLLKRSASPARRTARA